LYFQHLVYANNLLELVVILRTIFSVYNDESYVYLMIGDLFPSLSSSIMTHQEYLKILNEKYQFPSFHSYSDLKDLVTFQTSDTCLLQ
jgi:hypothetical protein